MCDARAVAVRGFLQSLYPELFGSIVIELAGETGTRKNMADNRRADVHLWLTAPLRTPTAKPTPKPEPAASPRPRPRNSGESMLPASERPLRAVPAAQAAKEDKEREREVREGGRCAASQRRWGIVRHDPQWVVNYVVPSGAWHEVRGNQISIWLNAKARPSRDADRLWYMATACDLKEKLRVPAPGSVVRRNIVHVGAELTAHDLTSGGAAAFLGGHSERGPERYVILIEGPEAGSDIRPPG